MILELMFPCRNADCKATLFSHVVVKHNALDLIVLCPHCGQGHDVTDDIKISLRPVQVEMDLK